MGSNNNNASSAQGSITYLNTKDFVPTANLMKDYAEKFNTEKERIRDATNALLEVWQGDARNSFESKYNFLYSKLEDVEDWFVDTYEALLNANNTYEDYDQAIADQILGEEK